MTLIAWLPFLQQWPISSIHRITCRQWNLFDILIGKWSLACIALHDVVVLTIRIGTDDLESRVAFQALVRHSGRDDNDISLFNRNSDTRRAAEHEPCSSLVYP